MEMNTDFVDFLEPGVTSHLLELLFNPADVVRATAVSQSWRHFIIANGICKKLWLRKVPHVSRISFGVDGSDEVIKLLNIASSKAIDWGTLVREHKIYSSLLEPLARSIASPDDVLGHPLGASSAPNGQLVDIIHTLTPVERYSSGTTSSWCSTGATDPDVPEHIVYGLKYEICVVNEIKIRPFEAYLEPGNPVYSPMSVRFRLGHPSKITGDSSDPDLYTWSYTSPVFPVKQEATLQEFKLPEPAVCVGGVLLVELLGRAQKKEEDGLFYICVGYVQVLGHQLDPAYNLVTLNSREFHLKYCPRDLDRDYRCIARRTNEKLLRILQRASEAPAHDDEADDEAGP